MAMSCDAFCDAPTARIMDQTAGRYNDRSAFANNAAQDTYNHMSTAVLVESLNILQQHGLATALLSLRSIQGQPQT